MWFGLADGVRQNGHEGHFGQGAKRPARRAEGNPPLSAKKSQPFGVGFFCL